MPFDVHNKIIIACMTICVAAAEMRLTMTEGESYADVPFTHTQQQQRRQRGISYHEQKRGNRMLPDQNNDSDDDADHDRPKRVLISFFPLPTFLSQEPENMRCMQILIAERT